MISLATSSDSVPPLSPFLRVDEVASFDFLLACFSVTKFFKVDSLSVLLGSDSNKLRFARSVSVEGSSVPVASAVAGSTFDATSR